MEKPVDGSRTSATHEREHGFDTLGPEQSRSHLIKGGKNEDFPMQVPEPPVAYDEVTRDAQNIMEQYPDLEENVNRMHEESRKETLKEAGIENGQIEQSPPKR